jgi:hypothetical protein
MFSRGTKKHKVRGELGVSLVKSITLTWLELIFWLELKVWVDPNELEYKPLSYEHFFRDQNILVIPKKRKKKFKKKYFFSSQKILKMEIKHARVFGQHKILYQKIKKKFIFEIL